MADLDEGSPNQQPGHSDQKTASTPTPIPENNAEGETLSTVPSSVGNSL